MTEPHFLVSWPAHDRHWSLARCRKTECPLLSGYDESKRLMRSSSTIMSSPIVKRINLEREDWRFGCGLCIAFPFHMDDADHLYPFLVLCSHFPSLHPPYTFFNTYNNN